MVLDSKKELEEYLTSVLIGFVDGEVYHDILTDETFEEEAVQLNLGSYGIPDIVRWRYIHETRNVECQITEVKKGKLDKDALYQAFRYKKGIERFFDCVDFVGEPWTVSLQIVLVGSSVDKRSEFMYLVDAINFVSAYSYSLDMDTGISFTNESGYKLVEEDFNERLNDLFFDIVEVE